MLFYFYNLQLLWTRFKNGKYVNISSLDVQNVSLSGTLLRIFSL